MGYVQSAINDMYLRALECRDTVLTDLPADSEGAIAAEGLRGQYDIIIGKSAEQSGFSGTAKMGAAQRKQARKNIFGYLSRLAASGKIIGRKITGFEQKYPTPSGKDDNQLLADARSVAPQALADKAHFTGRGIKLEYLQKGAEFVEDFEESLETSYGALSSRGEATGSKTSAYEKADEFFDSLDDFVKNYYSDQPQKLAAWKIATRVERSPKRENTEEKK
ncbi:MAG: hypothetical protein ABWZ66_02505 [Pyrinomonadaceae bacterium]